MSFKDWSEALKNLVTAAALVIGGLWAFYQWDALFPKTSAEVRSVASTVRTEVSGTLNVQLGLTSDDGSNLTFEDGRRSWYGYCEDGGTHLKLSTPVFASLVLESGSAIPVSAKVDKITISTAPLLSPFLEISESSAAGATHSFSVTPVAEVTTQSAFLGSAQENRVEQGQQVKVGLMFNAAIPLECDQQEVLILFQADVTLTALDVTSPYKTVGSAKKVFVSACQLNPRTAAQCNIESIQAYGQ